MAELLANCRGARLDAEGIGLENCFGTTVHARAEFCI